MSGGGTKVVKGRMGSRIVADVSPAELEAMEKTLENETKAAAVLLHDYYTLILYSLFFCFFLVGYAIFRPRDFVARFFEARFAHFKKL